MMKFIGHTDNVKAFESNYRIWPASYKRVDHPDLGTIGDQVGYSSYLNYQFKYCSESLQSNKLGNLLSVYIYK